MTVADIYCKEAVARYLYHCQKNETRPTKSGYNKWRQRDDDDVGYAPSHGAIRAHLGPWSQLVKVLGDPAVMRTLVYMPD